MADRVDRSDDSTSAIIRRDDEHIAVEILLKISRG